MKDRKCKVCGNSISESDEAIPFKRGYVHKKCFTNITKINDSVEKKPIKKEKPSAPVVKERKLAIPVSEEEYKEKRGIIEYLETLTGERTTAKVYKLLDDYCKKYNFNFNGILNALTYYYEVLENSPQGDCIGIVPYVYDEAQSYMNKLEESIHINDNITSAEIANMYKKEKILLRRTVEIPDQINIANIL